MPFSHYHDPIKARKIWIEYERDLELEGLLEPALEALNTCDKADELDIKLSELYNQIEISKKLLNRRKSIHIPDIDSRGGYSNARRALEEQP